MWSLGNEHGKGEVTTRVFWNPLVNWVWIGWMIVLFGVLFAMTKRAPKIVSTPKSEPAKEAIA